VGEDEGERSSSSASWTSLGRFMFGGAWKGKSVGEMYLRDVDGPGALRSGVSSKMGVIGGGGVIGVSLNEDVRRGEDIGPP